MQRAIKSIRKQFSWTGVQKMRELQALLRLPPHPHVVQLFEVHRERSSLIHFVFEYMSAGSLFDLMEQRQQRQGQQVKEKSPMPGLPDVDARDLWYQLLLGVQHLHDNGIVHRDLKPENILLVPAVPIPGYSTADDGHDMNRFPLVCKVADFSLARHTSEQDPVTTYVSTRWYRAPEILLASPHYSTPVDLWAVGCLAAELYFATPLFPGRDETDQLHRIFGLLGSPEAADWIEGTQLLKRLGVQAWPVPDRSASQSFRRSFESRGDDSAQVGTEVGEFLLQFLHLDPSKRVSADQAIHHDFFPSASQQRVSTNVDGASSDLSSVSSCPSDGPRATITSTGPPQYHYLNQQHPVTVSPRPVEQKKASQAFDKNREINPYLTQNTSQRVTKKHRVAVKSGKTDYSSKNPLSF